ncbi:Hypothetical predicted protein [Pelobates cultripes]|uniref:Uncharacterized protein n=1 Tax=Pelobates cultripes TaxID=61616 RepID=A0AAD1VVK8_PELCU|nr:Hypothetical predicted protein [Pelobates cultripes]
MVERCASLEPLSYAAQGLISHLHWASGRLIAGFESLIEAHIKRLRSCCMAQIMRPCAHWTGEAADLSGRSCSVAINTSWGPRYCPLGPVGVIPDQLGVRANTTKATTNNKMADAAEVKSDILSRLESMFNNFWCKLEDRMHQPVLSHSHERSLQLPTPDMQRKTTVAAVHWAPK